jgi:UDP-2-acetamido-2,6-beta-L-arabino-hexul-4-ose reductase
VKTVLVTGSEGFIGKNLLAHLRQRKELDIIGHDIGDTKAMLKSALERSDFVFHLAGVNRPKDASEFISGNKDLTEEILGIIAATGRKTPVLISSSIQAALENPYGKSKLAAEEAVFAYGKAQGVNVYVFRLPNVFGKWCRPNYNSVVATWCHNTANGLPIQINNPSTELTLVYIDDVVNAFISAFEGKLTPEADGFCRVPLVYNISLGEMADTLAAFATSRKNLVMPSLDDDFVRKLYGTWLSYLPEDGFGYPLEMKRDDRGWLAEFIKSKAFGQVFVSRTKPGVTRGNHWHHTKVEKFLVISGTAIIRFRKIDTAEVIEYSVSGNELKVLDIPVGYTHSITNTGSEDLITIFWADEIFNSETPDTYFQAV